MGCMHEDPRREKEGVRPGAGADGDQAPGGGGVSAGTPYSAPWCNDLALQIALKQAEQAAADLIEREVFRSPFAPAASLARGPSRPAPGGRCQATPA
jgi:hypothetical protein